MEKIYQTLRADHEEIRRLLLEIEKTTEDAAETRYQLLDELKVKLLPHARAEEETFYSRLREQDEDEEAQELSMQCSVEHELAEELLEQLESTDPASREWTAKFTVLKENLEDHIEQEETELFQRAAKLFSEDEETTLGVFFAREKEQARKLLH